MVFVDLFVNEHHLQALVQFFVTPNQSYLQVFLLSKQVKYCPKDVQKFSNFVFIMDLKSRLYED